MGSSSSKHQKKANSSRSTQPTKRQDARRPVDQSRPLPPQPTYSPPTRNQQLPPQSKHSRHRQPQAPAPSGRAPTQSRKAPPRPRRNPSPSTQAGNRQSILWPGLLDADYQAALPPSFTDGDAPGAYLLSVSAYPLVPRPAAQKTPTPRREPVPPPTPADSRSSVFYPGLLDNAYQEGLPPSFAPQSLVYSALHPATSCKRPTCPVKVPHCEGPYQHEGVPGKGNHAVWGVCNPPPDVWAAFERQRKGKASWEDIDLVLRFSECHSEGYNQHWRPEQYE